MYAAVVRAVVVGFLAAIACSSEIAAQPRDFNLAVPQYPPGTAAFESVQSLFKGLSENGDFHTKSIPTDAFTNVLEALRLGAVDMALVPTSLLIKTNPNFAIFSLPFAFEDIGQVQKFQDSEVGQKLLGSLNEIDLKGLDYWTFGIVQLLSKKPIHEASDLQGAIVAAFGPAIAKTVLEAIGAKVVSLPRNEIVEALDRGTIDASVFPGPIAAEALRPQKDVRYLNATNQQYLGGILIANSAFWNGLPNDVQSRTIEAIHRARRQADDLVIGAMTSQTDALLRSGVNVVIPTMAAFKSWRQTAANVWQSEGGDSAILQAALAIGAPGGGDACTIGKCRCLNRTCSKDCCQRRPENYSAAEIVRGQISEIFPGLVIFNPPPEMTVGNLEQVTVRVTRDLGEAQIKKGLQGRGDPQIENIEVGTFMSARLFGDGFDITSHSDKGQVILDKHFAEWNFELLPLEPGKKTLHLQIAIRFKLQNDEETTDLPVLNREITVQVNRWWAVRHFATNNWQWFLGGFGTLLMGVGGYFGRRWFDQKPRKKRRRSDRRGGRRLLAQGHPPVTV